MPAQFRNSFSAGYIDPLLYARADLRKWKAACVQMDNVVTLPQGGFKRRPGTKFVATYDAGTQMRWETFRVGYSTEYPIGFIAGATPSSLGSLDIYSTADALLTTLNLPYTALEVSGIGLTQELDTMILFHEDIAPHRLLRSTLESDSIDSPLATHGPLETVSGQAYVLVRHIEHGLLTGDEIGISGASAIGGFTTADLNRPHQVTRIAGIITADSVVCTQLTNDVTITVGAAHGFLVGERIDVRGLEGIQFTDTVTGEDYTVSVIPSSELNRIQIITAVGATTVTFEVPTTVPADQGTVSGNVTLGGADGTWNAVDKYKATHSGMPNATSTVIAGGGSAPLVWSLSSLAPDATRKTAITNVPKYNYKDASSPAPGNEVQQIIFNQMAAGNRYRVEFNGVSGQGAGFGTIEYVAAVESNAENIQGRLNAMAERTGITVEYDVIATAAGSAGDEIYRVDFGGDAAQRDWDPVIITVTQSTAGTATVQTIADGGSTSEDVWSNTRGWPRAGVFHQRRLWMVASASRPLTVWASIPEDFFNFEVADRQPTDAIDNTGQFDPIRHIVACSTGLHLLTIGGVVDIVPDRDTGGFAHPLNFKTGDSVGSTALAPVILAGLVMYQDTIARGIRQVRPDEADRLVAEEVSLFATSLIGNTRGMATVRNADGDYCMVVNGDDGTIACLCLDVGQQVLGWTRFVTDGTFVDVTSAGGFMYVAVDRDNGRFLEKFDPAYFTDCGKIQAGSQVSAWTGLDHLDGQLCDVRGDEATLDQETPAAGAITSQAAGVDYPCDTIEVGLPFDVSVQPTPPVIARKTRLTEATIDVLESREFMVGGYPVVTRSALSLVNPEPLVSGLYKVPLRGWGQRSTVAIAQRAPQPLTVRGLQMVSA